jgi:hypothetical protein
MKQAALLQLEARKKEAFRKFLGFMLRNREVEGLSDEAREAYVEGLRLGYGNGLTEGFEMGFDIASESAGSFGASGVGSA